MSILAYSFNFVHAHQFKAKLGFPNCVLYHILMFTFTCTENKYNCEERNVNIHMFIFS